MGLCVCILLLLMFSVPDGVLQLGCRLQAWTEDSYSSEGDILIGGVFVVHSGVTSSTFPLEQKPDYISCEGLNMRYYRDLLAMVFAIEEINRTPELLPNITLGFRIFDSCMSERRASKAVLEILSGTRGLVPGFRCSTQPLLAGIVGDVFSSLSVPMARIMGILHYPQISHASLLTILSDKRQFPSFLRTLPNYAFLNIAIAKMIGHFQWTWVGMIVSDDEVGLQGGQGIRKDIEDNGGCVAFIEQMNLRYSKEKVLQVAKMIKAHSVKVIIVNSLELHVKMLLQVLYELHVSTKIFIFTSLFTLTPGILTNQAWKLFNGSLGIAPYTDQMTDFQMFLSNLHPTGYPQDIFLKLFWEKSFDCTFGNSSETADAAMQELDNRPKSCSGKEALGTRIRSVFELNDLSYTYHSYTAVYAFAHGLHALISCTPGQGPFNSGSCANIRNIQPWQILHYLKKLHFKTRTGNEIFFDANGDVPADYIILNVQISQDQEFQVVKVGKLDPSGKNGRYIIINNSVILWSDGSSQPPQSACSASCHPGYRKAPREGEPVCCYDCIPCSVGEISNETDSINCLKCPASQWPNERRNRCIQKVIDFLKYDELLGLTLIISATILTFISVFILWVFITYGGTPLVKANNRWLSYLLLSALIFCFLCSFIFISRPTELTCVLRQTVFGIVFTISVSSVLAKAIIVVLAFKATSPISSARKWLGPKTPRYIVLLCSLVQIVICVVWILKTPPFPELNMNLYKEKIIFECNEGQHLFFYCMLGYMGLLATVSFIVAFLSRNLPGSFNEAKLITFSMLVFVSVWISFIPAYLSTRGKYMVAVEVFAILCSGAGLLGCIFFPKCYIILVKPDRNTREHLVGKSNFVNKKRE